MPLKRVLSHLPSRWRLIDQPLSIQFMMAGGVVAFSSIVSLIVLLSLVRSQTEVSRGVVRTHRMISRLDALASDIYRQRAVLFDYIGTKDDNYISAVTDLRKTFEKDFDSVR